MKNLRLKYNDIELEMESDFEITKSAQEVTYSDINCNWDKPMSALPLKYQEVQIINKDTNKIESYGYINTYSFNAMRERDVETDISINLLSPMKLATVRYVVANGTYELKQLIEKIIFAPLIADGFEIAQLDVSDRQITTNYNLESIEYCMNNLSSKFNFWWYIDENKKIYVIDIDILKNKEPIASYTDTQTITGLQYIKPITNSDDFANVINFKNLRLYQKSAFDYADGEINQYELPLIPERVTSLKTGEEIIFQYPVDIKKENIIKSALSTGNTTGKGCYGLFMIVKYQNENYETVRIWVNYNGTYEMTNNIGFDDDNQQKKFSLIRDGFFNNLITGFRYNGETTITEIVHISSDSILVWNILKFYNDEGIKMLKDKVSKTGIVETTVDMNESWKTINEITEIAKTYLDKNSLSYADELELRCDSSSLNVGDIIHIEKFGINNNYIITSIDELASKNDIDYIIHCKISNILGSYIDTFRKENTQISDDRTYEMYVSHYSNEGITQTVEVMSNDNTE